MEEIRMNALKKLFQEATKAKMPMVAAPGAAIGIMTL